MNWNGFMLDCVESGRNFDSHHLLPLQESRSGAIAGRPVTEGSAGMGCGLNACVSKPFNLQTIGDAMQRV
jgi:hypothetical protein